MRRHPSGVRRPGRGYIMIQGHGGNRLKLAERLNCSPEDIIDMSANLNPLGPPDYVHTVIREKISAIHRLPEPDAITMAQGFARYHGIDPSSVLAGNGTTFFIYTLPMALAPERALILGPTYSDYQDACGAAGVSFDLCAATAENGFAPDLDAVSAMAGQADLVFICNPNNPTGALIPKPDLKTLILAHPKTVFLVDESYLPFVENAEALSFAGDTDIDNLLVLSSMSKIFRIPGLRTGFISGARPLIEKLAAHYQPWSVNSLAQEVITDIFNHPERIAPFYEETRAFINAEKIRFLEQVEDLSGIRFYDGATYFILAQLSGTGAADFCDKVGEDRILIRDCTNFNGLCDRFVRFSLKERGTNDMLAQSIRKVLSRG